MLLLVRLHFSRAPMSTCTLEIFFESVKRGSGEKIVGSLDIFAWRMKIPYDIRHGIALLECIHLTSSLAMITSVNNLISSAFNAAHYRCFITFMTLRENDLSRQRRPKNTHSLNVLSSLRMYLVFSFRLHASYTFSLVRKTLPASSVARK